MTAFGWPNWGWFRTLKASSRSSLSTDPNRVCLMSEASMLNCPGPRSALRDVLPNVAVVSAGGAKHEVLNHLSIVGSLSVGSQFVFGRLVTPVESMLWVCVTLTGMP